MFKQIRFYSRSLKGRLKVVTFTFDHMFVPYKAELFFSKFFNLPSTQNVLNIPHIKTIVHVKDVRCTLTDMNIFHKLSSVTNKCGRIKKRVNEVFERILISDKLRECLLIEDSDCYLTFTEKEREEFLFRLFKHICIGGEICQQEDDIKPYIDITRKIYHDLICAHKNPDSGLVEILSHVYEVQVFDDQNNMVFPSNEEHINTFAYAIVDPFKRNMIIFYHIFGCGEFF
ncbi:Cilia- and flagella-associated protein [Schistosoma japonicum]|nr:Cilia- and flagella-associated protein [Schistosoma japonicum]